MVNIVIEYMCDYGVRCMLLNKYLNVYITSVKLFKFCSTILSIWIVSAVFSSVVRSLLMAKMN